MQTNRCAKLKYYNLQSFYQYYKSEKPEMIYHISLSKFLFEGARNKR